MQQSPPHILQHAEIHSLVYTVLSQRIRETESVERVRPFSRLYESTSRQLEVPLSDYIEQLVFFTSYTISVIITLYI